MPSYRLKPIIEYDATRDDSRDRENEILAVIQRIPGVSVTCELEAEEVLRSPGDDIDYEPV